MEASPSVLLVTNEPSALESVSAELAVAGLRTRTFESAGEAAAQVKARAYDVAIIAAELPDSSGADLVERLKQARPEIGCIVVTSQPSRSEALRSLSAGALAYMAGPPRAEAVVELVKELRRHALASTAEALNVRVEEEDGAPLLRLAGDLDIMTAPLLQRRFDELLGAGHDRLLVDAESLDFCDSTGLRVLISARRRLADRSGELRLLRTSSVVQRLLEVSHLDAGLLPV